MAFAGHHGGPCGPALGGDREPSELSERESAYRSIVFVLHGIRARNDTWVSDLEALLRQDPTVCVVTASYGRISAYNFAFPLTRRRNLYWFQDQYTFRLANHPDLPIHFVGHSNGTYVFGQSLRRIRAMRFDRIFLAGSVLPRDFDWPAFKSNGRIAGYRSWRTSPCRSSE